MSRGNMLAKFEFIPGIVCCNTASGLLGMSKCSDWRFDFFYEGNDSEIRSRMFRAIPVGDLSQIQTQQVGRLTVTTPFQTIIDMIRFGCDIEFTCDSLDWWEWKYGNLDEIEHALKERGLYEKYMEDYYPYFVSKSY